MPENREVMRRVTDLLMRSRTEAERTAAEHTAVNSA